MNLDNVVWATLMMLGVMSIPFTVLLGIGYLGRQKRYAVPTGARRTLEED